MKRKTLFLLISALLAPLAARAQSTPQTAPQSAQQPAKPYSTLDDDPQFKRLSPEQRELLRKMMESVNKAIAADKNTGATQKAAPPTPVPAPNAQPGCTALPVKKPRFHIPKPFQDVINNGAKQIGNKTGINLDPNAPAQAVNDGQKDAQGKPCPASPAPKPANQ